MNAIMIHQVQLLVITQTESHLHKIQYHFQLTAGSDATTLQGFMASEVTLGTIDSTVAGFLCWDVLVSKEH